MQEPVIKELAEVEDTKVIDKESYSLLRTKKLQMQETNYRKQFDSILKDMKRNLINTVDLNPSSTSSPSNVNYYTYTLPNGETNMVSQLRPMVQESSTTSVPLSNEAIVFSKINIATSLMFSKSPDAKFEHPNKPYAMVNYHLWRDTWLTTESNSVNAFSAFGQNVVGCGFGAFKTHYRVVTQPVVDKDGKESQRLLYDGIYRQSLDPSRIWVGIGHSQSDYWSKCEYLYEEDIAYEDLIVQIEQSGREVTPEICGAIKDQFDDDKDKNIDSKELCVITHYENELTNTYLVMCGSYKLYHGPIVTPNGYASISTANFYVRDNKDPYGVGLWEMLRGSEKLINHLSNLTTEQVEAEIRPLIFGVKIGNGSNRWQRGPGVINEKQAGTSIDVVSTNGNVVGAMNYILNRKESMDDVGGVNKLLGGNDTEVTVAGTVIAQEAGMKRFAIPKNRVADLVERDAKICISYFKEYYIGGHEYEFDDQSLELFKQTNPNYFPVSVEKQGSISRVVFSKKMNIPFTININTADEEAEGVEYDDEQPSSTHRKELVHRMNTIIERNEWDDAIRVVVDTSSMLEAPQELQQQKIVSLYPVIKQSLIETMQFAQQDPELGKALMKQLVWFLESQNVDPTKVLPRNIIDAILVGEMVNPQMQQLAAMNRMGEVQQQMSEVGMPQQVDMNNMPQTADSMRDAANSMQFRNPNLQ